MIEITNAVMIEAILFASILVTVLGLIQCSSIIFEFDGYFREHGLSAEDAQPVKRNKFMTRLRAPMYGTFAGEAMLIVLLALGITENYATAMLAMMVLIFLVVIMMLARHFYKAGRAV